ncbi:MAG: exodeoxyribonuclease VII large subunit [bacterium]|nr:exodeoxyribonuclease VII large subunit [bacterium]
MMNEREQRDGDGPVDTSLNPLTDKSLKVYSVSEINELIKQILKSSFPAIYIKGEISNLKRSAMNHLFFSLKDERSLINCMIFENDLKKMKFRLEDGQKIVAFGNLTVFEKRGSYNFIMKEAFPEGKGALQLAFEQLKKKLEKEGLFDKARKKPIPEYPQSIGIITAPHGAALRDILKIIDKRFPNVNIILYPALVQGANSHKTIIKGIHVFNAFFPVDVLILARGGGSIEDLWAFNEEELAYAIHGSKIPVISAVGHEIDYTIADFVADLRAPTPTAAAEMVVKKKSDILDSIRLCSDRILKMMDDRMKDNKVDFDYLLEQYRNISGNILKAKSHKFNLLFQKYIQASDMRMTKEKNRFSTLFQHYRSSILTRISNETNRFKNLANQLALLNPFLILERGYSIAYKLPENSIIKKSRHVKPEDTVKIKLSKGEIICRVEESREK